MSTPQLLAARRQLKGRLLLTAPAMLVLLVFLLAPLAIMFLVSILQSGDYGGVVWGQYSLDAYINFLYERDLDDSWVFNTDYLQIFQRSLLLSLLTTAGCLLIGFPTALYLALQSERKRNLLLFLVTVPFWTNLLVRVYAWILLLRNGCLVDSGLGLIGLGDGALGILYTNTAVMIGLLYSFLPFMVLPIYEEAETGVYYNTSVLVDADRAFIEALWNLPADSLPRQAGSGTVGMFEQMAAGQIKACWIICTNPLVSLPDSRRIEKALQKASTFIASPQPLHFDKLNAQEERES